jgi:predicted lipoprotein with Yx(FWY)xxD motif
MRILWKTFAGVAFSCAVAGNGISYAASSAPPVKEDFVVEPMPPGFGVLHSDLEGPVFVDERGRTLYKWPKRALRNGNSGEIENKPACDETVYRENAGLMSPYPGGLVLPDQAKRRSCIAVWPPVLAAADAKSVGNWTVVEGPNGRKQWAYDKAPLYTSILDKRPGEVFGGTNTPLFGESPAERYPVGPRSNLPAQFSVRTTMLGRMVTLNDNWSVYTFDGDRRHKSNCVDSCLASYEPILAASLARGTGDWTTFERSPGVRQWAFRGRPVYRHLDDQKVAALDGSDTPGWHNVYTQRAPAPPKGFVMKDTIIGVVLGDSRGMTVYRYACGDDAPDQLTCDHPSSPQVYRFAVCGGGDPTRCVQTFPYVIAPKDAKSDNQVWGTMYIDPATGKETRPQQAGALHVWTFRDRPVYTFAGTRGYGDTSTTDVNANNWGEFSGARNGYRALVYRPVFD